MKTSNRLVVVIDLGCDVCPLSFEGGESESLFCNAAKDGRRGYADVAAFIGKPSPDWCPLRAGVVVVTVAP